MKSVRLIIVGGFLGAGKTMLLWKAASCLVAKGHRVGLITNDQAPDLVDTALLSQRGMAVQEVAESCFCCNFPGLISAAEKLKHDVQADVLIAEPVGSCTDLSATILQPLKDKFAQKFILTPLSVLADPARLKDVLASKQSRLNKGPAYIFRKQLEEADIIVINKTDLLSDEELQGTIELVAKQFPNTEIKSLSALTGEGIDEWLETIHSGRPAGKKIAEVDYDTYAEGEAVLGWLNASIRLTAKKGSASWCGYCDDLMDALHQSFKERNAEVGHVKLLLSAGGEWYMANLTQIEGEVIKRGEMQGTPKEVNLLLNGRVEMSPQELESLVREHLDKVAGKEIMVEINHLQSLSPARPVPTHRYDKTV